MGKSSLDVERTGKLGGKREVVLETNFLGCYNDIA